jgi:N-acetylmuramic acid 6-phosphate etherase
MVDLQPRSAKLRARAERLVAELGRVSAPRARRLLDQARGSAKVAIVMARRRVTVGEARGKLRAAGGFLGRAAGI